MPRNGTGGALLAEGTLGRMPAYGTAHLALLALTVLWAGIAVTGNALTGANYGYLNHAPDGPGLLDVMGPWPQYLVVEAVAIAVVWTLMTRPWVVRDRRLLTPAAGSAALLRRRSPASSPGVAAC